MTTDHDAHTAPPATSRPAEILLVVDSPADAATSVHALREAGAHHNRVHVVGDGQAALAFLHRRGRYTAAPRPDLILLDLNLPRTDGREVLTAINTDEHLRGIPVIILTTSSTDTDILRAYELGANCYVSKPVGLDDFPPRDPRHRKPLAEPGPIPPGIPQPNSLTSHQKSRRRQARKPRERSLVVGYLPAIFLTKSDAAHV